MPHSRATIADLSPNSDDESSNNNIHELVARIDEHEGLTVLAKDRVVRGDRERETRPDADGKSDKASDRRDDERVQERRYDERRDEACFSAGELYEKRLRDPARATISYSRVRSTSSRYAEAQKRLQKLRG